MRFLIDIAIAIAIAVVVGIASAWYAIDRGMPFGAVVLGDWTTWPGVGSATADPYSLATLARTGEVPLGAGEGIAFSADADHDGEPLVGTCSYRLVGQTPPGRLWTLTAYDGEGRLMVNPARRQGFHSREIVRKPDGSFEIIASTEVAAGNWLPLGRTDRFRLVFRLYDTPLTTGSMAEATMPQILRDSCS